MCMSMLCVMHAALKQHQAFATRKLQPRRATLPTEWVHTLLDHLEALAPRCAGEVDVDADEMLFTHEALYVELSMALFRQYTAGGGSVHGMYLEWLMCDMELCAEDDAGSPRILTMFRPVASTAVIPGPRVRWCLAHGAAGAAALLRAYLRAFEFALDWHELALAPTLTPADETEMRAARQSALYESIDTRIWEIEEHDMGVPARAENIHNCLFLERKEYTAMLHDPGDPHGTVLGAIPPTAPSSELRRLALGGLAPLHTPYTVAF